LAAADITTAMRLIAALSSYWLLRGVRYEGVAPARQVLAVLGPNPPEGMEEEFALCVMAVVSTLSDAEEFAAHVAAAARVVEAMNRLARRFPVLTLLWAPFAGVPDPGLDTMVAVEEFLIGHEDPWYRALAHLGVGFQGWLVRADAELGQREMEIAYDGFRRQGDRWGMITTLNVLADLADYRGELGDAVALLGRALVLAEELDSALDMAELLCNRAAYSLRAGDHVAATAFCERAVRLSRRAGAPETLAMAHLGLGDAARLRGDLATALDLCEQALAECPIGWFSSNSTRSAVLVALGRIAVAEGDAARARTYFGDAATTERAAMRFPLAGAVTAVAAAGLALLEGDPRRAAVLLGAAEALRGSPLDGPDASDAAATARAALGDQAYATAVAEGSALSREAAIDGVISYVNPA
ncbi:MAG TPA: tetratricopeptide repeat protein, partial [Streptomyces sp.]